MSEDNATFQTHDIDSGSASPSAQASDVGAILKEAGLDKPPPVNPATQLKAAEEAPAPAEAEAPVHGTEAHEVEGYKPPSPQDQMTTEFNQIQQHTQYLGQVEQALVSDYNSVDWNALEAQSPADAVILRQQFQQRKAQLDQQTLQAKSAFDSLDKRAQVANANYITNQIPSWKNPETAAEDIAGISQMLRQNNYSEEEIAAVKDVRTITMLYDQYKAKQNPGQTPGIARSRLKRVSAIDKAFNKAKKLSNSSSDPSRVIGNLLSNLGAGLR